MSDDLLMRIRLQAEDHASSVLQAVREEGRRRATSALDAAAPVDSRDAHMSDDQDVHYGR